MRSEKLRLLPAHLRDIAKATFDEIDDGTKMDWRAATTTLKAHFSSDYFLDIAKEKFTDMKMLVEKSQWCSLTGLKKHSRSLLWSPIGRPPIISAEYGFRQRITGQHRENLKLLWPLTTNCDQLVKDAERIWNIVRVDGSTSENGTLTA